MLKRALLASLACATQLACSSAVEQSPDSFVSVTSLGQASGVIVESVTYDSDGLLIHGQICRPDDSAVHPIVVMNHGGFLGLTTELFTGDFSDATNFCVSAAKAGLVIAESSYRGEDGSEGKVEVCLGEVDDVLALLNIVRAQAYADPKRVAALGGSHGGCITTAVALRDPSLEAIVDYYGPTDLAVLDGWWHEQIDENEPEPFCQAPAGQASPCLAVHQGLISDLEVPAGGTPAMVPAAYAARSPLPKLAQLTVPTLILQGTDDALVNLDQACLKRAAMPGLQAYFLDDNLNEANPADVCGGGYLMTPLPAGATKAGLARRSLLRRLARPGTRLRRRGRNARGHARQRLHPLAAVMRSCNRGRWF